MSIGPAFEGKDGRQPNDEETRVDPEGHDEHEVALGKKLNVFAAHALHDVPSGIVPEEQITLPINRTWALYEGNSVHTFVPDCT